MNTHKDVSDKDKKKNRKQIQTRVIIKSEVMNECLNKWITKLMGLHITECLGYDVLNFLAIRAIKKEEEEDEM